jgi:hypothetical protein
LPATLYKNELYTEHFSVAMKSDECSYDYELLNKKGQLHIHGSISEWTYARVAE